MDNQDSPPGSPSSAATEELPAAGPPNAGATDEGLGIFLDNEPGQGAANSTTENANHGSNGIANDNGEGVNGESDSANANYNGGSENANNNHGAASGNSNDGNSNENGNADDSGATESIPADLIELIIRDSDGVITQFRIKRKMTFRKLFAAYANLNTQDVQSLRFLFDGMKLSENDTADAREMENGDIIEAVMEQIGGFFHDLGAT